MLQGDWYIPEGIELTEGRSGSGPRLQFPLMATTKPLRNAEGLWARLAQIKRTPVAVLKFARRSGFLGPKSPYTYCGEPVPGQHHPAGKQITVPVREWYRVADELKAAMELRNAVNKKTTSSERWLKQHIGRGNPPYCWYSYEVQGQQRTFDVEWLGGKLPMSSLNIAEELLRALVRERIAQFGTVAACFDFNQNNKLIPRFMPTSLEAALWIQFAESISKGVQIKTCVWCGDLFEPERSDAMYCSDSHKVMASRNNRKSKPNGKRKPKKKEP